MTTKSNIAAGRAGIATVLPAGERGRLNPLSFFAVVFASLATAIVLWPGNAGATARAATVTVTAGKPTEFGFTLSTKTVKHGTVTFKVTNRGAIPHDFKICKTGGSANACAGVGTKQLSTGQSATLTYTFTKAGTYEYLCAVAGHAAGGMKGDLKVT